MENSKRLELVRKNDQFGNGFWKGIEPHPEKNFGVFIYVDKMVVAEVAMTVTGEETEYFPSSRARKKISVAIMATDDKISDANLLAFGIVAQGRDDWQGTEFTSSDNRSHPEDETWDTVLWEDNVSCPVCRKKGKKIILSDEHGELVGEYRKSVV